MSNDKKEESQMLDQIDNKLSEAIEKALRRSKRTITSHDLEMKSFGEVEEELKIEHKKPEFPFEWQLSEKSGWQFHYLDFVSHKKMIEDWNCVEKYLDKQRKKEQRE